ncbi:MAG TPA: hypothetical protein VNL35_18375 [Chloroflexota bacterium]|nr:hypothetical protein [Chloroflexota bacterium]
MAEAIRISLNPDRLVAKQDGAPVESEIIIQNLGSTVDQYAVELDQLPSTWYSLSNVSVALFPQDKETAKLVIHPPQGSGTKAGTYPFTVTALSRADPSQSSRADGVLQIGSVASFEAQINPSKITGRRGKYTLTLKNGGNADIEVELSAEDAEDGCGFSFSPKVAHIAAGQKATVNLRVRPRRSSIAGPRKYFDFQVKAAPNAGPAKTMTAQLIHKPFFLTWRPLRRLIFLFIVLAAIVTGYLYVEANHLSLANSKICNNSKLPFCSNNSAAMPTPVGQVGGGKPRFIGAFNDFHQHYRALVGDPVENESTYKGVATQFTSTGMLIYDHHGGVSFLVRHDSTVYKFDNGVSVQVR